MSIKTPSEMEVPEDTREVAKKAFPKGNLYMTLRDEFGTIYTDKQFTSLYSVRGRPAIAPWRLALVTILQFGENLSDPQAADSVRSRIDWKYLLGLELTDPGFDFSVLSEFRTRLIKGSAEMELLNTLLGLFKQRGLLKERQKQRSDSTDVLAAIRDLNRLECVHEAMRKALNKIAQVAGGWLQDRAPIEWYERYGERFDQYHFAKSKGAFQAWTVTMGADGYQLMEWAYAEEAPTVVRGLDEVEILRRIWVQNFYQYEDIVQWRGTGELPPSEIFIRSPHDLDVRYSHHGNKEWMGYRVHMTEICEPDSPHFITHVETTLATTPDVAVTQTIHKALIDKGVPPSEHWVDAGYVDAETLVVSQQQQGIDVVGPTPLDTSWQAREGRGYGLANFSIDWQQHIVTCPQGKTSRIWSESHDSYGNEAIHVRFATADCRACSVRPLCTKAKKNPRSLKLRTQAQHEALQHARHYQKHSEFWERYSLRSGIEGTLSQGVRNNGLRRTRYIGLAKTHLQMVITAVAMILARFAAWIHGIPLASTRVSPFAALAPT
jgi:transposase